MGFAQVMERVQELSVARAADSAGFCTAVALPKMGKKGYILAVKVREEAAPADEALTAKVWFADGTFAAVPDDLQRVYESAVFATAPATPATDAVFEDSLGPDKAPYVVDNIGDLFLNIEVVTAGGGGGTSGFLVDITYEVV